MNLLDINIEFLRLNERPEHRKNLFSTEMIVFLPILKCFSLLLFRFYTKDKIDKVNKFLCIDNISTNPYFNLALEEYLLKNYSDDIFMLWQNDDCIVVGKHQNALAEINRSFVNKENIKVARRLSGGGTVYHDSGNLNFTYIMNGQPGKMVDFAKYTDDIIHVLKALGIPAERNQRNDLIIEGKKISGNAEHIYKNRIIHHGTLLFNSNLDRLNEAIKGDSTKFEDKSVQSVRSKVTNIEPYLKNKITIEKLKQLLFDFALKNYKNAEMHIVKDSEYDHIKELEEKKYKTWEWIYGYSPKFKVKKLTKTSLGEMHIEIEVKKGIIENIILSGNELTINEKSNISNYFKGLKYDYNILIEHLEQSSDNQLIDKISTKELIDLFFG